jgi:hypothetical protein
VLAHSLQAIDVNSSAVRQPQQYGRVSECHGDRLRLSEPASQAVCACAAGQVFFLHTESRGPLSDLTRVVHIWPMQRAHHWSLASGTDQFVAETIDTALLWHSQVDQKDRAALTHRGELINILRARVGM